MPLTLEQFKEELDANFTEYTRTMYDQAPAEYPDIVRTKDTKRFFEKLGGVQGIHGPIENRDLEAIPFFIPVKSYTTIITQKFYRAGWVVERALVEMGQHGTAIDNLEDMTRSEKTLRDKTAVDLLNNGTAVQGYEPVEADGTRRSLFSTTHRREDNGAAISNYYQVAVPPNLDTIYEVGMNYLHRLTDGVGNFVGGYGVLTLIVPSNNPGFVKAADVIAASMEDPFTTNRSVNTAKTRFRIAQPVVSNQLTNSNYWYVRVDVNIRSYPLRMLNFQAPNFSALQMMANNPDAMYSRIRSVFGVGLGSTFRGIVVVGP